MFQNERFCTCGVNEEVPIVLQCMMWNMIDTMEVESIEVISGNSFELKDYAKVTDASNNVDLKYSGDVDVTKVGNYPITISAQDVSGNI